jgi:hypothetical protein
MPYARIVCGCSRVAHRLGEVIVGWIIDGRALQAGFSRIAPAHIEAERTRVDAPQLSGTQL